MELTGPFDAAAVPDGWVRVRVGDVATFASGQGIRVTSLQPRSPAYPIPVYGGNGVAGYTDRALTAHPCPVVGRVGQKCGAVYLTSGPAWITDNALYPTRIAKGTDAEFLALALAAAGLNDARNRNDLPLITQSILHATSIALPNSVEEQHALAAALRDVDGAAAALERLVAKKRDVKQAAMQRLLTGEQRLPGYTDVWQPARLCSVADLRIGRTPSRRVEAFWGPGHPWLSIGDMQGKWISESAEQITDLGTDGMPAVARGTLLLSFKLSVGRVGFAARDLYTNEAICCLLNIRADPEFMYYALQRVNFAAYGTQAVKGVTLNSESLRRVVVDLPSQEEQEAIATVLADMDAELAALEQRLTKTRALKQAMMQELLTGRTRLTPPAPEQPA